MASSSSTISTFTGCPPSRSWASQTAAPSCIGRNTLRLQASADTHAVTSWVRGGRSLGPDGAHRRIQVGPGGIALICAIQHLGRVRLTSLGLLNRAGEPIPDVAQIREHGWLLAEQFATTHGSYVPVTPVLVAAPYTRVRAGEPPIGFVVTTPWKVGAVLADLPTVLTAVDLRLVTARLRARPW